MSGYCGSYEAHVMGACACGVFHGQTHHLYEEEYSDMYSSVVDCTLSLGTPSTRLTEVHNSNRHDQRRSVSNSNSWGLLHSGHSHSNSSTHHRSTNDSLLARRCANCDTTVTPLWRNGPRGPKVLIHSFTLLTISSLKKSTTSQLGLKTLKYTSSH